MTRQFEPDAHPQDGVYGTFRVHAGIDIDENPSFLHAFLSKKSRFQQRYTDYWEPGGPFIWLHPDHFQKLWNVSFSEPERSIWVMIRDSRFQTPRQFVFF
jgi:hypothetical protein